MIRRTTWIALVLLAALIALAVWWSRRSGEGEAALPAGTPLPSPVWELTSDQILSLRVESPGEAKVLELVRDPQAGWRMTSPVHEAADAARVESAVTWLASPQVRAELPATEDLSPFGLQTPAYRLTIQTREGAEYAIEVGRTIPTGGLMYVRSPARSGVLMVSEYGVRDVLDLYDSLPYAATALPQLETTFVAPGPATAEAGMETATPGAINTPTP